MMAQVSEDLFFSKSVAVRAHQQIVICVVTSCPRTLVLAETLRRRPALPPYLLRQSSCAHYSLGPLTSGETIVLLLLPKHLPVGLAIGIEAIMFTPFPSGFQFGPGDVPVRTAFPQHNPQILPKLFDGRSA